MPYRRTEWCGRVRTSITAQGEEGGRRRQEAEREREERSGGGGSAQSLSSARKKGTAGRAQEKDSDRVKAVGV